MSKAAKESTIAPVAPKAERVKAAGFFNSTVIARDAEGNIQTIMKVPGYPISGKDAYRSKEENRLLDKAKELGGTYTFYTKTTVVDCRDRAAVELPASL